MKADLLLDKEREAAVLMIKTHHYAHSVPSGKSYYFRYADAIVVWSIPANKNIECLQVSTAMNNQPNSILDQFPANTHDRQAEENLVTQIGQGSDAALTVLVMANMREAILYTGRVCAGRLDEGERASLCYQEMCMSAKRFKPGRLRFFSFAKAGLRGRMKTYWESLRVVRNSQSILSVDTLGTENPRRDIRRHHASPDDDREQSHREAVTGEVVLPETEKIFVRDEWAVIRKRYARSLSEQQWMVLSLLYLSGFNLLKVGKLLGLSKARIHAIHWKAIKKLRFLLASNPRLLGDEDSRS
jgi:RNA polymerase sigma factor (sigma-70 family)